MKLREQLRKARTLMKWAAQGKVQKTKNTIKWILDKEGKITDDEKLLLKKREVIENLKNFVGLAKDFTKGTFAEKEINRIEGELNKDVHEIDFQELHTRLRRISDKLIRSYLDKWVLENAEEIERLLRDELELPDNVVIGTHSSLVTKEEIKNYRSSIAPDLNIKLQVALSLLKNIIVRNKTGPPGYILRELQERAKEDKAIAGALKQAQKVIDILDKDKDAIVIHPLGYSRKLNLGPEKHDSYVTMGELFSHEFGHQWELKELRKMGKNPLDTVYHEILSEAIGYMWEGVRGPYMLGDSADTAHIVGYEIAKNAEKLGIKPSDIIKGFKDPKRTVKDLLERLAKIDKSVAKKIKERLQIEGIDVS